jgi:uncharacterized repeat protein (TIGR01451 family)
MTSVQLVRRGAPIRAALISALLGLVLFSVIAASAQAVPLSGSAAPLPGSKFEGGDGNQVVDNPLNIDWATALGVRHFPDPQEDDEIFKGGSKENEPGLWDFVQQDGGSTPGKNNILDAYALVEQSATTGDTFLHLAFTREGDTGTTFMAFELNQRADLWDNGVSDKLIPCRTTGDIIVSLQVSGNDPDVILQRWTTTATDPTTGCATEGTLTDFTAFVDNVDAQGAVNDAPIPNSLPASFAWPGGMIGANLFVEASLNLTTLLEDVLGTPCFSFGSIWMHTRASTSDDSNLDDIVDPEPLLIRNCSAEGVKYHDLNANGNQDAGEPGLGGFRIWADYDNDGVRDANEPFDDTDPVTGAYSISNIQDPTGTYSLREQQTPPATGTGGWICSEPTTTGPNGDFPCGYTDIDGGVSPVVTGKDFGNYKKATVIVEKQTVPDGAAGSFAFTSTITGKANFNLTDGQTNSTEVVPGVYTAMETVPAGWSLTDITCSGDTVPPNSSDAGNTATFNAQSGETITCVFTNTKDATLTVVKVTDPASDPQDFDFDLTGSGVPADLDLDTDAGNATLPSQQSFTLSAAQLGAHTVTESVTAGWSLTNLACTGAGADSSTDLATRKATLDIDAGENVVCTFTNTKEASLKVVKVTDPASDPQDFDFDLTGSGLPADLDLDTDAGNATLPSEQTFALNAGQLGAKTVTESVTAGWSLTNLACTGAGADSSTDLATRKATLDIDAGETVVCTFTNTKDATLTVVKDAQPNDAQDFAFTTTGSQLSGFLLDDDGDGTLSNTQVFTISGGGFGAKTVTESEVAGWSLSALDCTEGTESLATRTATVQVDPGDAITCTFTNSQLGTVTVIKTEGELPLSEGSSWTFTLNGDEQTTDAAGEIAWTNLQPGEYTLCEVDIPEGWHTSLEQVEGAEVDPETGDVCITFDVAVGETVALDIDNFRPAILIEKAASVPEAYVGDTVTYTLEVSNPGVGALENVVVADPMCNGAPAFQGGDTDGDQKLDETETWTYTCPHVVTASDADPLVNVATATGEDKNGNTVTDDDTATVDILHPAIDIEKSGPASATQGDTLTYTLEVTNPGDIEFASDQVVVTDPQCDDQPTLVSKNGDASPQALNPGDRWTYTCSHVTTTSESSVTNVATVTGKDRNGRTVTDTDEIVTNLQAQLPDSPVNGTARLRGPSGCVNKAFTVTVRGTRIAQVTFFIDGKRYKRLTAPTAGKRWQVKINPRGRSFGVHRVTARVRFVAESETASRTLRLSFQRCKRQTVRPRFTG